MNLNGKTNAELIELRNKIEADPANQSPPGELYLYIPKARKKLDAINEQITYNLSVARAEAGNPVNAAGYSGRKSKKRR